MAERTKILLIYTGGTIGMVKDYQTGSLRAFDFKELVNNVPELNQLACDLSGVSFKVPIDSSNVSPLHWKRIAELIRDNYEKYDGFVVLHGSDTMSYSASALSFMLENLDKPVIFTGSQLPIGDLRTDAKENLITSIQIATLKEEGVPVIQEVGLYFEYKLYRGNRTTKLNAEHFEAFASLNHPPLVESGVHLNVSHTSLYRKTDSESFEIHTKMDSNVAVLKLFPGIGQSLVRTVCTTPGLKALILETYGAGNAPLETWFLTEVKQAIERGLFVINVTQCIGGSVQPGQYETSRELMEMQVANGKDITTESALAKTMYLLGKNLSALEFKAVFERSLRGEMV